MRAAPRSGLTLIELIVALVLASLLTAALLNILGSVVRETSQLRGEQIDLVAAGVLADRLRGDLINARGMAFDNQSLLLSGFVGDGQLPGSVRYRGRRVGDKAVLVREVGERVELCWVGFGGFAIVPQDEVDADTPIPDAAGSLPPIPRRVTIKVLDRSGRAIISEEVVHHED